MKRQKNQKFFSFNFLKKNQKAQFQISFAWLFAIIVGAFILFLAIYAAVKVINIGESATSARAGKEISVLLNPLETGFEAGKTTLLKMPVETRIRNRCSSAGNFGRQTIQLSQKSFNKWTETDIDIGFSNKYIFSEDITEGKNFFLFSKPFRFPFKIADMIYLTSAKKDYCFLNATERIEEEISDLNQDNLFTENCPDNSIKICFKGGSECDINVNEKLRSVEKRNQVMYYETDALMYAAIFSDKDIYECQIERIMQRAEELSLLYDDKATFLLSQGCLPEVNLFAFGSSVNSIKSSAELITIKSIADDIERENNLAECKLW
ncbi:MAG TPA: hypothetical protein ENI22_01060 [Candidatus Pacearchaeota archaeon]|nr:hypothetical protein [Candidatus Pacearchaeota archaeon]